MPSLGNLFVNIGADTKGLQTGANRAESRLTKLRGTMNKVAAGAARLGGAMGAAGAAIITAAVKQSSQAVTQQTRLARSLGTTNKEVAGLTSAFKAYGLQQEDVSDAINSITDRAQDAASGMESMADDFALVGMSVDELKGRQPAELFRSFAESIRNTEDPAKRTAAAVRILGDDVGRKLLPLLMEGEQGLERFMQQAEDMGLAVSQVDARQIERANVAMSRISDAVAGVSRSLTVELAPIIEGVADEFTDAARKGEGFGSRVEQAVDSSIKTIGFLVDAVDGVSRVFRIGSKNAEVFATVVQKAALDATQAVIGTKKESEGVVDTVGNALLGIGKKALDSIGVSTKGAADDFAQLRQSVGKDTQELSQIIGNHRDDINDILSEPLAGSALQDWIEERRKDYKEDRKNAESHQQGLNSVVRTLGQERAAMLGAISDSVLEKENQNRKRNLQRLRKSMATERELEVMNFEKRMEWLKEARESELVTEMEFFKRMQALKMGHERKMTQIDNQGLSEREKFQKKSLDAQVSQVAGDLQQMTASVARENKAMFQLNKAAGIANAITATYQGANEALKLPFPLGETVAAARIAAGMARVNAIRSQSFSGGGGSGSGGGGGAPAQTGARSTQQGTGAGEGGASSPTTMINLQGDSFGRDQVRDLLERINEENRDGGRLVIN